MRLSRMQLNYGQKKGRSIPRSTTGSTALSIPCPIGMLPRSSIYDFSSGKPYSRRATTGDGLIMCYQNERRTPLSVQFKHEFYDLGACCGIKVACRFVRQHK